MAKEEIAFLLKNAKEQAKEQAKEMLQRAKEKKELREALEAEEGQQVGGDAVDDHLAKSDGVFDHLDDMGPTFGLVRLEYARWGKSAER